MRKANPADKAVVTGILSRSFADNLSVNFITGDSPKKKQRTNALMNYAFEACSHFGEVLVTDDLRGCALLLYPEQKKTIFKSVILDINLMWSCIGLGKVFKVLKREASVKQLQATGKRAYVWFIGVDPSYQHKGIGSMLMREVITFCEKQGRFLMLETSTLKNIPWYKSFGFATYATLDLGYRLFFLKKDLQ